MTLLRDRSELVQRSALFLRTRQAAAVPVKVLLFVYAVLATWYSLTIPLGEAPDEVPHFTYVRYLAQHRRLPTTLEEHEAFQPPLYYALGAALSFWAQDDPDAPFAVRTNADYDVVDPRAPKNLLLHTADEAWPYRGWALAWHLVRMLSIALGAVTVWAIYRLGLVLVDAGAPRCPGTGHRAIPLAMAALTAFTPQFLFMSAVANNDNAATAFSALVLWQVAALLHETERRRLWLRSLLLGLLLGLGLLSKANLIALLPIAGLAILVAVLRFPELEAKKRVGLVAGCWLLAFGLAALLSGWYFVRNWLSYGDPLGWALTLKINALREGPLTVDVLAWLLKGVFRSFWLGWIGIAFDEPIYWLIAALCLVGLVGFVVWLFRSWSQLSPATRWTLLLLGLHTAMTVGSLLQWTATVLGTDQGRLIYPILPEIMLVLVFGWAWWVPCRFQKLVLGGLVAGMFGLAVLTPVRYIAPVHAPASTATQEELAAAVPLNMDWDGVRLLGYYLEDNRVQPGGKLVLRLYWQALRPLDRDLWALIQLVDGEDRFLMYTDGSPTAGRDTTDRWRPGVPLASYHLLPVPDYGQPGPYRLTISLHPFGESTWLKAVGPDGSPVGDRFVLTETVHIVGQ
jgi:4-amino-4-deoxy-L-arabinose transferase-like glycosyltransferase